MNYSIPRALTGPGKRIFEEIHQYFQNVDTENGRPKCLIADTIKGYGLSFTQGVAKWHFRSPNDEELKLGLKELST